jgi:hypothetical protein
MKTPEITYKVVVILPNGNQESGDKVYKLSDAIKAALYEREKLIKIFPNFHEMLAEIEEEVHENGEHFNRDWAYDNCLMQLELVKYVNEEPMPFEASEFEGIKGAEEFAEHFEITGWAMCKDEFWNE